MVIPHLVVMTYFAMNPSPITPVILKERNAANVRKDAITEQN